MATSNEALKDKLNGKAPAPTQNVTKLPIATWYKNNQKQLYAAADGDRELAKRIYVSLHESFRKNPGLMNCTSDSLGNCMIQSAMTGLLPEPWGDCAYIPRGNTATFMPDYKGLVKLARQCGAIETAQAGVVHEQDTFIFEMGTEPKCQFIPNFSIPNRGGKLCVFVCLKLPAGHFEVDVMSVAEVEEVRQGCSNARSLPWQKHWDEMAKKTLLRRMLKTHTKDPRLARAIQLDYALEHPERGQTQESIITSVVESKELTQSTEISDNGVVGDA